MFVSDRNDFLSVKFWFINAQWEFTAWTQYYSNKINKKHKLVSDYNTFRTTDGYGEFAV